MPCPTFNGRFVPNTEVSGSFKNTAMGVISIGELPIGRAEILQIKGSASALGRQALRNSSILFFLPARLARLRPMRMSASHRLSSDNRATVKIRSQRNRRGDIPNQWSKLTNHRSQARRENHDEHAIGT